MNSSRVSLCITIDDGGTFTIKVVIVEAILVETTNSLVKFTIKFVKQLPNYRNKIGFSK
jgi:hypothetical protein